jgi:hypothetical protein
MRRDVTAATCVVDEDRRLGGVDEAANVVCDQEISVHEPCAAATFGRGLPAAILVDVGRHHLCTGGRERPRDGAAGSDPRSRHDCHVARDLHLTRCSSAAREAARCAAASDDTGSVARSRTMGSHAAALRQKQRCAQLPPLAREIAAHPGTSDGMAALSDSEVRGAGSTASVGE